MADTNSMELLSPSQLVSGTWHSTSI